MNSTAHPAQKHQRDVAIAAIAEAIEQIGHAGERSAPVEPPFDVEQGAARDPSERQAVAAIRSRRWPSRALAYWSFIGLLAATEMWVASFVWQSADGNAPAAQSTAEHVSISPASAGKEQEPAEATVQSNDGTKTTTPAKPSPPTEAATRGDAPTTTMTSPEAMQWIQTIAHELANLEHGIEQLRADQAQLARDNAEHLKEMQDLTARHHAELIATLKAAQSEMIRDSMNTFEQLRTSQEQVAIIGEKIKAIQEQMGRLAASEQQPRPKTLVSPQPPIVAPTRKPASPPPARL